MAELFNNKPGAVAVLATNYTDDNPFRLTIDGFPRTGQSGGLILTELAVHRAGNYQFLHTLKDLVYVYSFGERMGQLRASGMCFSRMCRGSTQDGLSTLLSFYEANRLEMKPDPISIIIGTSAAGRFRGFLTEMNVEVSRPDARLSQFGLSFHALPSTQSGGGGGG